MFEASGVKSILVYNCAVTEGASMKIKANLSLRLFHFTPPACLFNVAVSDLFEWTHILVNR